MRRFDCYSSNLVQVFYCFVLFFQKRKRNLMLQEMPLGVDTLLAKLTCKVMGKNTRRWRRIRERIGGWRNRGWGQCVE